ncbi:MAG: ankyrin repeat domain-containing protein [Gammaproteobacteria bacterium]|nr:ankyrin repeat domain-containing protein [Gammaproteobacteria bacterium]MDH5802991.1 ankyrin repeat domain-containing protein [Gammaproteobacteria bacterium]
MKMSVFILLFCMLIVACGNSLKSILSDIKEGKVQFVMSAIENSPGLVKEKTDTGNTVLFESLRYGHDDLSKRAIQLGADVNITNSQGVTPLYFSTNKEIAKYLIDNGADKHIKTFEGTPLHWAVKRGDVGLVTLYIQEGLQIDYKSGRGNTALDLAIKRNNEKVANILKSAMESK